MAFPRFPSEGQATVAWVLATLSALLVAADNTDTTVTYSGYIVDNFCFEYQLQNGIAFDGSDVLGDPASHTVHCMRDVEVCRTYYMAENAGTPDEPDYQRKFVFDSEGNAKALAMMYNTTKANDYKVTVTGTHTGNGILKVATIEECDGPDCDGVCEGACETPSPLNYVTYAGYLVDIFCYDLMQTNGVAFDGTDVLTSPWDHTVHCMRDVPQCRTYYVAQNIGSDGEANYQQGFVLNDEGNVMALELLQATEKAADFHVTVTGVHTGDRNLQVATITECEGHAECDGICTGACDVLQVPTTTTTTSDSHVVGQAPATAWPAAAVLLAMLTLLPSAS